MSDKVPPKVGGAYAPHYLDLYERNRPGFGAVDVLSIGPGRFAERLGELIFMLCMMYDAEGRKAFSHIRVLLPPRSAALNVDEVGVRIAAREAVGRVRGEAITPKEIEALDRRIEVVSSPDLEVESAVGITRQAQRKSAVVVCNAARYRAHGIPSSRHPSREDPVLPDDIWVPHVCSLATQCVAAANENECYVALDTGEFAPYREENLQHLTAVEGIGVFVVSEKESVAQTVAANLEQWTGLIKAGRIGAALSAIDALPEPAGPHKESIKAQLLHRAGLHVEALRLVRKVAAAASDMAAELRVKFARIAADAGDERLAAELLAPAIGLLPTPELLEYAHTVAEEIGDEASEDGCLARLRTEFPKSRRIQWARLLALLNARNYEGVRQMTTERNPVFSPESAAFYEALVGKLDVKKEPRYDELIELTQSRWPDLLEEARILCLRDADARRLGPRALELCVQRTDKGLSGASARAVLRSIQRMFLGRDEDAVLDPDALRGPLRTVIVYLSRNPADAETRAALARLLAVRLSGSVGLPLMAMVAIDFAQRGTRVRDVPQIKRPRLDEVGLKPFLKGAFAWLEREGEIQLGRYSLPKELLTGPADDLLHAMTALVQYAGERLADEKDLIAHERFIAVGCMLAPHSSTPDEDLTILRLGAGRLALAGRMQRARDLAEQALQVAGDNPRRARLAWFAYADIYHRVHNLMEALVGIACAEASDAEITAEEAWYETNGFMRLLRDLNLIELAKPLVPVGRALLRRMGVEALNAHRLDTVELGVRMAEIRRDAPIDGTKLLALVGDLEKNCEAVLERNDETTPVASLLAQALYFATYSNVAVDPKPSQTLERALQTVGEPAASMIRTISTQSPAAADVIRMASRLEEARYSEDVGFDVRALVIAAHRLLDSEEAAEDARVATLAVELLADQAVSKPARVDNVPGTFSSIEAAAALAQKISRDGVTVMMLGLSESGRLARVTAKDGALDKVAYEPTDVFSRKYFADWAKRFPYAYGDLSDVGNEVHASMRGLGISAPAEGRVVLITDTSLQQVPPNLLLAPDNFAGRIAAMAAAPSLSWLSAARAAGPDERRRAIAWISTVAKEGESQALATVAERLQETLQKHNIRLHTGGNIPDGIDGSELAVIGAHGGIVPEGRYFQVVADEGSLRVDSRTLARALRDTRLVILFVCSGGRVDQHPLASTTVGLVKELLDRGCLTVIASPWPLNASVPPYWLPAFLDAWAKGEPVIDANFQANHAVARALGDSPAYCLAMTVYGDPLLRKNR